MSNYYIVGAYRITYSCRKALAALRDGKQVHSAQLLALRRHGLIDDCDTVYDEVMESFNKAFPCP